MSTLHDTLRLELGERSYPIHIGEGLLNTLGATMRPLLPGKQVAVVSNETVAPLYLERATAALTAAGYQVIPVVLPDGERFKEWQTLNTIFDVLIQHRFERSGTLVALGGGVVGDMTGFAAASLLRGVNYVQVPTTLLSQVDSSVGGKTGINHPLGKNLIGAFYQPRLVVIDLETLKTLPRRELLAGMAEVIKYGIIRDAALFGLLERHMAELLALDPHKLGRVIHTCCDIKAEVVAADEREAGQRALLNLGHTFGHAIEALAGYGNWLHGEAVAAGMVMAADLSRRLGLCEPEAAQRVERLIALAGLPTRAPHHPLSAYLGAMARDKKVEGGQLRFVLMTGIGHALIHKEVPTEAVEATLKACMAPG